jgi:two-component sensor histidine kinase
VSRARITVELCSEADSNLMLTVKDNGVGFPAKIDFRNTNTLGLQLVCVLTEQLIGTIELDSGNGARFYIVFPASGRKNVTH